jgi:hypothetical protein
MKLVVVGFLAALAAAPLAAQAAGSQVRFAVTLQATAADRFTYEVSRTDGECMVRRSGSGGGELRVRSIRPVRIQVRAASGGVVYRPRRLVVRLTGKSSGGSFDEVRICRAEPIERTHQECPAAELRPRVIRPRFHRPSRKRIAFQSSPRPTEPVHLCGLARRPLLRAWVDLAEGSIDEGALLEGRSRRVIARGTATRQGPVLEESALNMKRRATVSWTLTFRRLG